MPASALIQKIIATNPCITEMFEDKGKIYTFLNPVSYLDALDNRALFSNFDGIFVDGKFLVLAIKLFYWRTIKRRSFDMTSIAPELFRYSEVHGKSIYIVAGKQYEVERAVAIFGKHYPKLNFAGYRNGYFNGEQEIDAEIQKIVALNPDYVVCGMGIIRQENFLSRLKSAGFKGVAFTCGGFISQTSMAEITYYPRFFDLFNLRFLYRMFKEKHTRKRYFLAFFGFPFQFIKEKILG